MGLLLKPNLASGDKYHMPTHTFLYVPVLEMIVLLCLPLPQEFLLLCLEGLNFKYLVFED